MSVTSHQALSIAIIIYFSPAFFVAVWVCRCHGFGKQLGWLYMTLLCLARVVGSALQIASEINHDSSLHTAANVIASVGIMALLLGMLEIIDQFESTLQFKPVHKRAWTFLHIAQYAAFILYAVGMGMGRTDLNRAASIIVVVVFAVQVAICVVLFRHKRELPGDNRLLLVAITSIPFLAVRAAYGLSTMFVASDSAFITGLTNVLVSAFLQYLMEFIVSTLFLYAGVAFLPPKQVESNESGIILIDDNEIGGNYTELPPSR
ncbi:hypothetical protein N7471_007278 [Penicillium samsonianum]|uniref:uncharacterized protein n=1 Tax=Penicillium samsonianum TaxID=1882272 RepID=UPI0025488DB7|nr:uncharacterized protein N7471_007278 [Penicillium samsonianum]KAJ6132063.1 hypothetical protein N7471_007278 [Penicillium samsonianum]